MNKYRFLKYLNLGIIFFIAVHLILLAYFLAFRQFFQQDEWHSFGLILSLKERYITLDHPFWELLLGDRVGARIVAFSLFNLFKLNPVPYGMVAFFYHSVNTLLVFFLAFKLTRQKLTSLLASLFFLVNEVGNEAYSWFGTMNGSATTVIFFLLSLLMFLRYLDNRKYCFNLGSLALLWVSFLFKETAIFAFFLYPLIFWIYTKEKDRLKFFLKSLTPFVILAIVILVFMAKTVLSIEGERANYVSASTSFVANLIKHSFQYPLEGAVQTLFPNAFILPLSSFFSRIFSRSLAPDTIEFELFVQNTGAEIVLLALFIFGIGAFWWQIRRHKDEITPEIGRTLIVSASMLFLSFLPYVVLTRSFAYLDSRHYYVASVAASIFLATFIFNLIGINRRKSQVISLSLIAGYLLLHELILFSDFKLLAGRSRERQGFLKQALQLVPKLPKKAVFFVTGNFVGYYGLPELKVPFQSGPGHVLMVTYTVQGQLDSVFFKEEPWKKAFDVGFLYDILGQGYREINRRGFGYYYDEGDLQKALSQNLFAKSDVISLFYDSDIKMLTRHEY